MAAQGLDLDNPAPGWLVVHAIAEMDDPNKCPVFIISLQQCN